MSSLRSLRAKRILSSSTRTNRTTIRSAEPLAGLIATARAVALATTFLCVLSESSGIPMGNNNTDVMLNYEIELMIATLVDGFKSAKGKIWFPLKPAIVWASGFTDLNANLSVLRIGRRALKEPNAHRAEDDMYVLKKTMKCLTEDRNFFSTGRVRLAAENCTAIFTDKSSFAYFTARRNELEHKKKKEYDESVRWLPTSGGN